MSTPKYPSYKDVPIPWIASIPEHWDWKPVLGAACQRDEDNKGMKEDNLLSLSYGNIINKDINTSDGLLPESFETYQIVRPGDIVLRLTDLQNDKRSLRSALVTQTGIITSAYLALKPESIDPKYLGYLLRAYDVSKVFYSMGGGLRQSMKYGDIKRMPLVIPTKAEQFEIASFLDRETAKIDALIAVQRRLIELLQEKRQAVISHAVTKGLNPNAPMKDSGVEWLGEVPEHWTICPLKHFCKITTGFAFKSDEFQVEGIPLVRISDIQSDGTIDLKDAKYLKESELIDHPREALKHGDIAMAMTGGTIGKAGIYSSDEPALLNQRVCIFRAKPDCSQAFLWLITASRFYQEHIKLSSFGGAQPNISDGDLLACICPMPPLAEQERISVFIDSKAAKLGELQREADSTIELLNERRSTLISAAVTGQIDVRGLAEAEGSEQ